MECYSRLKAKVLSSHKRVGEKVECMLPCEKSQSEEAICWGIPTRGGRWEKDQRLLGIKGKEVTRDRVWRAGGRN